MARLGQVYVADDLPDSEFGVIPAGEYSAVAEEVTVATTKSGSGQIMKIKWKVTGPERVGAAVWDNINFVNDSAKAQEIGLAQLKKILNAVGLKAMQDTDQLIGLTCMIKVAIQPAKDEHAEKNIVKGYAPMQSGSVSAVAPSATTKAKPKWAK